MRLKLLQNIFILNHQGALYWEDQNILIIADLHLGKIEHFRKHGSALPNLSNAVDYIHLEQNIAEYSPKQVVFLGDLFHSSLNKSWQIFEQWVKRQPVEFTLIVGNHDIIPTSQFEKLGFQIVNHLDISAFSLTHKPEETGELYNICGHIHPGYRLRGKAKQQLKLSCFYQKPKQMILPAYGSFTGNFYITPDEGDHIYVLSETEVIQVV
ncbi:ligase-associated DNA damage response endonuclease PdeM [Mesohalobacter halotolerans]|uniref:Ligase-associated DNA damage response endonuclease PdeM n=1 Tax=Mesohalobacter halotolerans TaxID=1883405 RepID=A0A4U5TUU5_9FLAO|nr:ligase-associated DNA damage response endonuclease PdeM [Mesohalobacter halotolerans]MBS3737564.1 ligase-associated DNA damage response endonuclease PdeM [Psychroflexus sp.]TKS57314.1 ligase-associated DNA damage response endonuclease PdeM [Mesohalobacter halotolerans]